MVMSCKARLTRLAPQNSLFCAGLALPMLSPEQALQQVFTVKSGMVLLQTVTSKPSPKCSQVA